LNPVQELIDGKIFSIIKPIGWTSFDVVKKVRNITGIKKVGHAGTLDPFAEGLLIVGVGRSATRQLGKYLEQDKEYIGRVVFGIITDTYDPTGKVVERIDYKMPSEELILETLRKFEGKTEQLPPIYSAIKVGGVRMYKAARSGLELERKPRNINIYSLNLTRMLSDGFEMKVKCSKGTYIRSLAYDIGHTLGVGAHLASLTRTRIGDFGLQQAQTLEAFEQWALNPVGDSDGGN